MTPPRLMRALLPSRLQPTTHAGPTIAAAKTAITSSTAASAPCNPRACLRNCRCFAHVHDIDRLERNVWFTSTMPRYSESKPPDERTLQLGKTVRTLHERLPSLLLSPLPSDILSPNISLHLFPSTHPHLPTVSGRMGYVAALYTAPLAWGRLPILGNVKLDILSERMVRNGGSGVPLASRDEKLIVKWKTRGRSSNNGSTTLYRGIGARDPVDKLKEFLGGAGEMSFSRKKADQEFCGIFIFEFDEEGRISKHVIEHTEEGGRFDHMTRVVSVTDWLLGQFNGRKKEQQVPELAWCEERPAGGAIRIVDRRRRMR